jgi:hypothetical protein
LSLKKVVYVDNVTVITAEQMNAIQDAIIDNEEKIKKYSWNSLLDKPFGDAPSYGAQLAWNGDTDGLITDSSGTFYKVYNCILPLSYLNSPRDDVKIVYKLAGDGPLDLNAEDVRYKNVTVHGESYTHTWFCAISENEAGKDLNGVTFPEAGTYFLKNSAGDYTERLIASGHEFVDGGVRKLNVKYLPMDAILAAVEEHYINVAEVGM